MRRKAGRTTTNYKRLEPDDKANIYIPSQFLFLLDVANRSLA